MIGKNIGHYKVVQKLGEGGMGEVFLAEDTKLNRQVALKFLPSQYALEENFKARFKREARAAAALNHPNIITIHEVSEHRGRPFIAMEYVEGESLKDLIAEKDLSFGKVIDIAGQICAGLAAAHKSGIIHRDIKPQNILMGKEGRVRILDFGLAKLERDAMLTRTGSTVGTVAYMSPEQVKGEEVDHRSDIFSFGVVLYELITTQTPFRGEHEAAVMHSILSDTPEPLARYKADVPEELQRIADKALRKDAGTRYQSAADLGADLKELRKEATTQATLSTKSVYRPVLRRRSRSILVAALVVVVVVAAGYFLIERIPVQAPPGGEMLPEVGWRSSIAVLPFRDFSPNQDQLYFCDGMTDALIGKLSGLQDLKVISMSSVMRFRDPERDIKEIGRELGVAAVLEGSIQKEDSRIRLSAQLINVADGAHLWSQTYDREVNSVFAIQDEISRAIVDVLKIRLLGDDRTAFVKRHTDNLEAYNAYTQGRFLWNKRTEEHILKSIEYFEKAIELDPDYALAYVGLADAYAVLPSNVGTPVEEVLPKAREAVKKALELDDELAEAHASLGLISGMGEERENAEKEFLRAIELNPGYAYAHYWYSTWLGSMGRTEAEMREVEIASELDPLSVVILTNLGCKKLARDSLKAEELIERAIEIEPSRMSTYAAYGRCLRDLGWYEKALAVYARALEAAPTHVETYNSLAYTYDAMGDFEKAIEHANKFIELAPDEANPYDSRGEIYAHAGRLDEAIADFEKALEIDPEFAPSSQRLILSYLFKREYGKAESLIKKALSIDEPYHRAAARTALAFIPMLQGKFNRALAVLDEGIAADRSELDRGWYDANKHGVKLYVYLAREEYDQLLTELDIIRGIQEEFQPEDLAKLRDAYAIIRAAQGRIAEAEELLRGWRADIDETDEGQMGLYWRTLGIVELIKGNPDAAVRYLNRGLWDGTKPLFEARYFLGQAYLEAGQPNEAAEILEKALSRYDERHASLPIWSVKAHYFLGMAYEQSNRTDKAIEQYEEFLEYWKDADPGISEVEDARVRLGKLKIGS
jgi:tetratricopeptide (TPR) repeat protein/predicted Ser/Thr protein kinase